MEEPWDRHKVLGTNRDPKDAQKADVRDLEKREWLWQSCFSEHMA